MQCIALPHPFCYFPPALCAGATSSNFGNSDTIDLSDAGIAAVVGPDRWYGLAFNASDTATYLTSLSFALYHSDLTYIGTKGLQTVVVTIAVHFVVNGAVVREPIASYPVIGTFLHTSLGSPSDALFFANLANSELVMDPAAAAAIGATGFMVVIYSQSPRFPMQLRYSTARDPPTGDLVPDAAYIRVRRGQTRTWFRHGPSRGFAAFSIGTSTALPAARVALGAVYDNTNLQVCGEIESHMKCTNLQVWGDI
jgi:hypothetical protein